MAHSDIGEHDTPKLSTSPSLVRFASISCADVIVERNFVENNGGVVPELLGTVQCFRRRTG